TSGSKENVKYYWSVGYNDNEGIILGDDYKTFRTRLNLDIDVTNWLTVGVNMHFANRDESSIQANWDGINGIVGNSPWGSKYKDDGITLRYSGVDDPIGSQNPIYNMSFQNRERIYNDLNSTLYANLTLPLGI